MQGNLLIQDLSASEVVAHSSFKKCCIVSEDSHNRDMILSDLLRQCKKIPNVSSLLFTGNFPSSLILNNVAEDCVALTRGKEDEFVTLLEQIVALQNNSMLNGEDVQMRCVLDQCWETRTIFRNPVIQDLFYCSLRYNMDLLCTASDFCEFPRNIQVQFRTIVIGTMRTLLGKKNLYDTCGLAEAMTLKQFIDLLHFTEQSGRYLIMRRTLQIYTCELAYLSTLQEVREALNFPEDHIYKTIWDYTKLEHPGTLDNIVYTKAEDIFVFNALRKLVKLEEKHLYTIIWQYLNEYISLSEPGRNEEI